MGSNNSYMPVDESLARKPTPTSGMIVEDPESRDLRSRPDNEVRVNLLEDTVVVF